MAPSFVLSLRRCPLAIQKALSLLSDASPRGETRRVEFRAGPPRNGFLPLRVLLDGKEECGLHLPDTYPSFLHEMRGWMERCLLLDREGSLHPEMLTLSCRSEVIHLVLIHVGWEEGDGRARPVSLLAIVSSRDEEPLMVCLCDTLETLAALYRALTDCLRRYSSRFDGDDWFDARRHDTLDGSPTSERLLGEIRSGVLERKLREFLGTER